MASGSHCPLPRGYTYNEVVKAVDSVLPEVTNMYSLAHRPIGHLFRIRKFKPSETITRARLFHTSFNDRQYVGTHRYSMPGFPCRYLGGSLRLCQRECRARKIRVSHRDSLLCSTPRDQVSGFRLPTRLCWRARARKTGNGHAQSGTGRIHCQICRVLAPNRCLFHANPVLWRS